MLWNEKKQIINNLYNILLLYIQKTHRANLLYVKEGPHQTHKRSYTGNGNNGIGKRLMKISVFICFIWISYGKILLEYFLMK
jgi:hypothetical protein